MAGERYTGVAEKAERGEYTLVVPLDFMLMEKLPPEGSTAFGLYPLGETVRNLPSKFTKEQRGALTPELISTRLRVLHIQKLVVSHRGTRASDGLVWQITPRGSALLKEKWEATKNGSNNDR